MWKPEASTKKVVKNKPVFVQINALPGMKRKTNHVHLASNPISVIAT